MSIIGNLLDRARAYAEEDGKIFEKLGEFWQKEYYALAKYELSREESERQSKSLSEGVDNVTPIKPTA